MYDHLIIDTSNLFFRSVYFGIEKLQSILSIPKYFLSEIENIKKQFGSENTTLWFLYDDSSFLLRRELESSYKQNRNRDRLPSIIYSLLCLSQEFLINSEQNYRVVNHYGLEADDLVKPTKSLVDNKKTLLISYDLDFSRYINSNCNWYNWKNIFDEKKFIEVFSFYPSHESVKLYKSLNGYKSDNIEVGVKDLTPLTLFQICRKAIDYNSLDDFKNDLSWIEKSDRSRIIKSFDKVELNYELCNFIEIQKPIDEIVDVGSKNKIQLKILLESVGLQLNLSKEEIENEFFNLL